MRGIDIKQAAENYVDEAIDDDEALTAINRALVLIGDRAHRYESVVLSVDQAGAWLSLPGELTSVREVVDAEGRPYEGYRVRGNRISFADTGRYTVHYRRLPTRMAGILETPDIHPAYHEALVTYVAAWWKLKDDDESPDGLRLMQEFEKQILRADIALSRDRGPKQWRVIRHA